MSRLGQELRDPWGLLLSGVSGGMVWAVAAGAVGTAALPLGIAAGAAVLGIKAVSGMLLGGDEPSSPEPATLQRPPHGTAAAAWLDRAEAAVGSLEELSSTASRGPLAEQVRAAVGEARDTLAALARLGAQATSVEGALRRVHDDRLDAEATRLAEQTRRGGPPEVLSELARSRAAVGDRLAVRDRLAAARATLLARMEAVALGLEGLVARLAEVLALASTTGGLDDPADEIAGLAAELEGLRGGLAETEALSRGALDAAPRLP